MHGLLHVIALILLVVGSALFIALLLRHRSLTRAKRDAWKHREAWERAAFEASQNRFQWLYSGLGVGEKNFMHDLGFIRTSDFLTREEAIARCAVLFPRGTIVHIDDVNKAITYKVV